MPSAEVAVRLAKMLGVSVEYLVTGAEDEKHGKDVASQVVKVVVKALSEKYGAVWPCSVKRFPGCPDFVPKIARNCPDFVPETAQNCLDFVSETA